MAISEAKLEANRRNSRLSTGPTTSKGKERSSRNAVTHGLRAENLIMVDEDPQELADRKEAWTASMLPRDDVEQSAVNDAVDYAWLRDRARRAQAARIAANITNAGVEEAKRESDEALRLGQKLFSDNNGPLAAYPHQDAELAYGSKRVSESKLVDDPEDPQRLVLHLQATASGCQWMLDQWSGLGDDPRGKASTGSRPTKLKAIRLLGRSIPSRRPMIRMCSWSFSPARRWRASPSPSFRRSGTSCANTKGSPTPDAWWGGVSIGSRPRVSRLAHARSAIWSMDRSISSSVRRRRSRPRPKCIAAAPR